MSRANRLRFQGTAERQAEAVKLLKDAGDVVLVERDVPRSLVIQCPDGCGEVITANLDPRAGKAWRLYRRPNGAMTVYPSIWRDTGCKAHFILWRDGIIWCDVWSDTDWDDGKLRTDILALLPAHNGEPCHYEDLAEKLGETPWEVLWECRAMTRAGAAVASDKATRFRAPPPGED